MFYLTLPSNSSLAYFPDNKASHFTTKLPQPQELDGEYEVGLAELQFSNSYRNVLKDKVYFEFESVEEITSGGNSGVASRKHCLRVEVPDGLYESNKYFITVLNKLATTRLVEFGATKTDPAVKFYYNPATRRASITMFMENTSLQLSPALMDILGISPETVVTGVGKYFGTHSMDLDQNVKSIFVYTDLVQPRPVGDVVVPLLRTLPPVDKEKETMHYMFEKPHYMPLARFQFDTVEILLTSDKGQPISFEHGHSIVTLHFRRKRLLV